MEKAQRWSRAQEEEEEVSWSIAIDFSGLSKPLLLMTGGRVASVAKGVPMPFVITWCVCLKERRRSANRRTGQSVTHKEREYFTLLECHCISGGRTTT